MHETKVHDKHGGAVAIQRPAASPAPNLKPPPVPSGPTQVGRTNSKPAGQSQQQAAALSKSHAQKQHSLRDPKAEAQSHRETDPSLSESDAAAVKGTTGPAQRSRKRRAISPEAAAVSHPPDPPSPPFPYPILARRAPQANRPVPAEQDTQQQPSGAQTKPDVSEPSRAAPADKAAVKANAHAAKSNKGKARLQADPSPSVVAAAAAQQAGALNSSIDKSEAVRASVGGAAGNLGSNDSALGGGGRAVGKLKRCGTCKHCLQKSGKQGCLLLRALREQASAAPGPPELQAAAESAKSAKPASTVKGTKATQAKKKQSSAEEPATAQAGKEGHNGSKPSSSQLGAAPLGGKAARQSRGSKKVASSRATKPGNAPAGPEGSIHSALTQAVQLASDMDQAEMAEQQQQQAAEALESLKHSPMGVPPSQPAGTQTSAPGQVAAAPASGHVEAAAVEASPLTRGRGRPRKKRKPGEEEGPPVSAGPKRGRGRPRKSPPQLSPAHEPHAPEDSIATAAQALHAAGPSASVPPGASSAHAVPVKVRIKLQSAGA